MPTQDSSFLCSCSIDVPYTRTSRRSRRTTKGALHVVVLYVFVLSASIRGSAIAFHWSTSLDPRRSSYTSFFGRDYGLYPSIPNNGESNFLLAHLFVGASHGTIRFCSMTMCVFLNRAVTLKAQTLFAKLMLRKM